VARRERDNDDLSSPRPDLGGADDGFFRIVAALYNNVRLEAIHEINRGILRENDYQIDAFQCGEDVRALRVATDWTSRAFQPTHRLVAIDPDDKRVCRLSRGA
jgi:hypothetical protein